MHVNKLFYWGALFIIASMLLWLVNGDFLILGIWITVLLLMIYSYVITLISFNKLDVQRVSRVKRQQAGSYYNERIIVINRSNFQKSWIELTSPLEQKFISKSKVICDIGKKNTRTINSQIYLDTRGIFNIGPGYIQSGDPFGFFLNKRELSIPKIKLVVYPHFEIIENLYFFPGNEFGGSNLRKQTPVTTPQAAGIREYLPGDPLNRVHWPKTAQMNQLMVKEFDEDTQSNVWIILDVQSGIHRKGPDTTTNGNEEHVTFFRRKSNYQLPKDSLEYAISIAASISDFFTRKNKSVGLICSSNQVHILFPDKGKTQFRKIMDTLTLVEDNGNYPINILLEKQIKNIPMGSSIIIITPVNAIDIRNEKESIKCRGIKLFMIHIRSDSFRGEENFEKKIEDDNTSSDTISIGFGDSIQKKLE